MLRDARARRRCRSQLLLLQESGRRCRMDEPRSILSPRVDSWSATSVLYSVVIVRTRPVLYGSVLFRGKRGGHTKPCARRSRRQSTRFGLESALAKWMAQRGKYCARLGWRGILRTRPGTAWGLEYMRPR